MSDESLIGKQKNDREFQAYITTIKLLADFIDQGRPGVKQENESKSSQAVNGTSTNPHPAT